jgi:hypothetical protein
MSDKLDSLQYFENSNWICPEKITIELYELSISIYTSFERLTKNTTKIKEIYIPEYNIGINK